MLGIVRLALSRPYTFVVMAILIAIFGARAAVTTPTDIFPNIGIPVISVIWTYAGLPADDMAGRITAPFERSLSTTVNDIEHIESQSLNGYGVVKIYFQPSVNINAAQAQVTSISQTILKQLPAGITPPQILSYNASSVPIIQVALSSATLSQTRTQRHRHQLHSSAAGDDRRRGAALALWRHGAAAANRSRPARASFIRSFGAGRRQRPRAAKPDHAGRHGEDREI